MHMVIVGCGRVGAQLASTLCLEGHSAAVIDRNPAAFARLGRDQRPRQVVGVGFDRDVLLQAGIERADAFASVTDNDSSNILSAIIARRAFSVPRVVARIADPVQAAIYRRLGIPTISPTTWGAAAIREIIITGDLTPRYIFGSGEVELVEFEVPLHLAGHTVAQFTGSGQMVVAALVRQGQAMVPGLQTQLAAGDLLYLTVDAMFKGKLAQMVAH